MKDFVVTDETAFHSDKVRALHAWWRAAGSGGMPYRRDFDVSNHRDMVSHLFLVRVVEDGFLFKLTGESAIRLFGHNNTGKTVRADSREDYGHGIYDYYRRVVEQRRCFMCLGTLTANDRVYVNFESLDCPLTDDGHTVSAIIGVVDAVRTAEGDSRLASSALKP